MTSFLSCVKERKSPCLEMCFITVLFSSCLKLVDLNFEANKYFLSERVGCHHTTTQREAGGKESVSVVSMGFSVTAG